MQDDTGTVIDQEKVATIPRKNILLFFGTVGSVFVVYFLLWSGSVRGSIYFTVSIILFLFSHEMGHFLACRAYRVPATWPYFIPFPLGIGTLGAVIKIKGIIPNKKALFDIGVAGPLMGLAVAIPLVVIGLYFSNIVEGPFPQGTIYFGEPLLFKFISRIILGDIPESKDVILHPVAFAGWFGLFVTALNLLPVGQLDGGHVIYSMFGRKVSKRVTTIAILSLIIVTVLINPYLFILIPLVYFVRKHPPTYDDSVPLDSRRFRIGIAVIVLFFLSATPRPIYYERDLKEEMIKESSQAIKAEAFMPSSADPACKTSYPYRPVLSGLSYDLRR